MTTKTDGDRIDGDPDNILEYWALDALSDTRLRLSLMLHPSAYEATLNRPTFRSGRQKMIEALTRLSARHLIACKDGSGENIDLAEALVLSKQAANDRNARLPYLELTREGGVVWEHWAIPEWDRFVGYHPLPQELEEDDEGYWYCLGATNLPAIENEVLWLASVGVVVVNATQSLAPVKFAPWMATYWKELPEAFQQAVKVIDTTVAAGDAVLSLQPGWTRFGIHKHRP